MHHTRKNRSLKKKTKALKKSRSKRSLKKKKSTKSRKMKGGISSCKWTFGDNFKTDRVTAWNNGNFTKDRIIKAIVLLIKQFNTLLGSDLDVVNYTFGDNRKKEITTTKVLDKPEQLVPELNKLKERKYTDVADVLEKYFKFYTVTDSTAPSSDSMSAIYKTEVDQCQLMKTIFYLMEGMKKSEVDVDTKKTDDDIAAYYKNELEQNMGRMKMFIDNEDVSNHFLSIAPALKISTIVDALSRKMEKDRAESDQMKIHLQKKIPTILSPPTLLRYWIAFQSDSGLSLLFCNQSSQRIRDIHLL